MDQFMTWKRQSAERISCDPTDTEAVKSLANKIYARVGDKRMHQSIAWKAAVAVLRKGLDLQHITEALDSIARQRDAIDKPGAYFVACLKRIFANEEIPWRDQPPSQPPIDPSNHPSRGE